MARTSEPAHDNHAEQIVIGAAMLNPAVLTVVELESDDFYRPAHALLWEQLGEAHAAGEPTDKAALIFRLADAKLLERAGGQRYVLDLTDKVPTIVNAPYYAKRIRELARRRNLIVVRDLIDQVSESGADADTAVALAREWLDANGGERWTEPVPLSDEAHRLPEFPIDSFPSWLADHVLAVAEFNQVPNDLPASLALACLSTAAGGKTLLEIAPGWVEPINIFTIVAMPPGTRKTPTFRAMVQPLKDAEKFLKEAARPRIIEARTAQKAAQATAERAEAKLTANATDDAMAEAVAAAMAADTITIPAVPKLLADDITPETAASLMAQQGGRLAILAPEGGIIGTIAGRYSGMPNFDIFLRGHGGDGLHVARKGRDEEEIERAALTLGVCLQPEVLRELYKIPGAKDKGLLARFLYALPADNVGFRNPNPAPISPAVADRYTTELRALAVSLADLPEPATVAFGPDASTAIRCLIAEVEPRLRPTGEWAHIRDWGSKWAGSVVGRLAGLLHIAEHLRDGWGRPVTASTVERATTIGRYYAAHALAAFDDMGADPTTNHARSALAWIERSGKNRFTKRELFTGIYRGRFSRADELNPILDLLEQHGYIRRLPEPPRTGPGRKPSPSYLVHPAISRPKLHAVPAPNAASAS